MKKFESIEQRLQMLKLRIADFPLERMRLSRLTYHAQKKMHRSANKALEPFHLVDATFRILLVLFGSANETASAAELALACQEKPANLTRLCNQLELSGFILRTVHRDDRRMVLAILTDAGRTRMLAALPQFLRNVELIYGGISVAQLRQLDNLLERQLDSLNVE